ncbi:MAG: membrane protein insertase YidC [Candidatus Tokpelaia sp.]|nr:MAG: membrane protein insertase YidC [Candidatus Tokpelaia sp.]KAA6207306.1 MAG: membrane protein insertase YidC [Candidatus Tokpelaia sp.]
MEYNRNFFLTIILSLGVILVWQWFFVSPANKTQKQEAQIAAKVEQEIAQTRPAAGQAGGAAKPADKFSDSAAAGSGILADMTVQARAAALERTPRVAIDTPQLTGSINLVGAMVDDILLKNYRLTIDKNSPNIALLNPQGFKQSYFFQFGYLANGLNAFLPDSKTVWQVENGNRPLTPQTPVTLRYDNAGLGADGRPGGVHLVFRRVIAVDDRFMFTVTDKVENLSNAPVALRFGARLLRNTPPPEAVNASYLLHEGLIGVMGAQGLQTQTYKKLARQEGEDRKIIFPAATGGWIGITDKYWAVALIPAQDKPFQGQFSYDSHDGGTVFQSAFAGDSFTLAPQTSRNFESRVFAGAKQVDTINDYQQKGGIAQFELLIDWGLLKIITKPMFTLIDMLYRLVGNFGVAILLVTVLLKLVLFPLANKSYKSMAHMKKVQPAMEHIRKKYADDRVKQQQAIMELYRKEKVNPLAGCWPLIVQFPIFFALYKVLYITIEMRQAPFFGWIHDLAAPDPTSLFNLFGALPYDVPGFLVIGAWPVIMGITMFLQMRMNPTPPDPTQAMIFTYMPLVFTWMLAAFPAGLVIYWAWNNTLSIIQQGVIMKKQGVKIELLDNLKALFVKKPREQTVAPAAGKKQKKKP